MKVYISLLAIFLLTGAGYKEKTITAPGTASDQPNIVLIMADDMGFSDIGCYGSEIHTPNIDRLAKEGIRFREMYNNAFCSPTRASLMTGLFPHEAGMGVLADSKKRPPGAYEGYLNDQCVTIAEILDQYGYYTALSGKWHLGESKPHWPTDRGFDNYFGLISGAANYYDIKKTKAPNVVRHMALNDQPFTPPDSGFYMTNAITDYAVKILNEQKQQKKPYFLYVAYTAPHWPLHALPEDIAKYKGKYFLGWDSLRVQRYKKQVAMGLFKNEVKMSPRDPEVQEWKNLSTKQKEEMAAKMEVYAAQIDRMDQGIGKILDAIEATGKKDNTIVIFLSDNGGCAEGGIWGFDNRKNGLPPGGVDSYMSYGQSWANASNTPFRYYKKWLHEGGISTPLIIRWPSKIAAQRDGKFVNQVCHVVDIVPTILDVAGAKYPQEYKGNKIQPLDGQSLLPEIAKGQTQQHKPIFWAVNGHKAILVGKYKLDAVSDNAPWELYDIENDRSELNDLASKYPDKVKELAAMWNAWADRVGIFKDRPPFDNE
jgi:arylsulfatase